MADNTTLPGTGDVIASDDIGGVKYQRIKVTTGADGSATDVSMANPMPVVNPAIGIGSFIGVPVASANGTLIGSKPAGAKGLRLYLASGDSITYTIAASAPGSPPSLTFTVSQSGTGPNWDEDLNGVDLYITAKSGSPMFRWF